MRYGLAGVLATALMVMLPAGGSAAGLRSCGTEVVQHSRVRVSVTLGHPSCATARSVIKAWLKGGHRVAHGPSNGSFAQKSWTMSDGWTCKEGTGGGVCFTGGTGPLRANHPRAAVDYVFTL